MTSDVDMLGLEGEQSLSLSMGNGRIDLFVEGPHGFVRLQPEKAKALADMIYRLLSYMGQPEDEHWE